MFAMNNGEERNAVCVRYKRQLKNGEMERGKVLIPVRYQITLNRHSNRLIVYRGVKTLRSDESKSYYDLVLPSTVSERRHRLKERIESESTHPTGLARRTNAKKKEEESKTRFFFSISFFFLFVFLVHHTFLY